jgi:hypothetical protein
MLGSMILIAVMIGQTTVDGGRVGPELSEAARKAQARDLAEFRANEHTIKARLDAYHRMEDELVKLANERLMDQIKMVNSATSLVLSVNGGSMWQSGFPYRGPFESRGFSSIPGAPSVTTSGRHDEAPREELRRANRLLKGQLRYSQYLNHQAVQMYYALRSPQHQRATCTPSRSSLSKRSEEQEDGK